MKKYLAIPAALAVAGGLLVASPAAADSVSGATLTWKISDCVFSACGASTAEQGLTGNVTRGTEAWQFTGGSGSYDPATGATDVSYTGSVSFGRTGAYTITFSDPQVVTSGGSGHVAADVKVQVTGQPDATTQDVRLVDLSSVPTATTWNVTPPWETVGKQFAQPLMDVLPASLQGFFKDTGTGTLNAYKPAAAVSVDLGTVTKTWTPKVAIEGADNLAVNKEATITVKGTGFDPAKKTGAVTGLYVVFGPNAATTGYGMEQQKAFGAAQYLPVAPDASGAFTTTLTITGRYTDQNGKSWDGTKDTLGVSTWAAHSHAITDWDTFTPITFAPATKAATTTKLTLQDAKIKAGKRAKAVVKVKGGTGKVEVKEGKKVLVTKKTDAKGQVTLKLPKLKVGKHTLKAVYLGSDQADRSVSKKVVLRVG